MPERQSDTVIKEICTKIVKSRDSVKFGKQALIWLIKQSENLSRLVYTETFDQVLGREMVYGVQGMNIEEGHTHLLMYMYCNLKLDIRFLSCCNGRNKNHETNWKISIISLAKGSYDKPILVPFDIEEIKAIDLSEYI